MIGGIIGARLYHVITDYQLFEGHPERIVQIWKGGLGIWGAVIGGAVAVWIVGRRRGLVFADIADSIVPGLAFAQAIGRWGNWFNQELFGGPSTLPWAVEIDRAHRPAGYAQYATFQPTFLYESLWCLALGFALLAVDRQFKLVRGQLVRVVRRGVHGVPAADGGDAHRPRAHHRTAAGERLGEHRRVRALGARVRLPRSARAPGRRDDDGRRDGPTVVGERAAP